MLLGLWPTVRAVRRRTEQHAATAGYCTDYTHTYVYGHGIGYRTDYTQRRGRTIARRRCRIRRRRYRT